MLSVPTEILLVVIFLLTGCVGGILAGLFGLGGGVLYVPIFLTIFNFVNPGGTANFHVAVATSLSLIVPSSITAVHRQYKQGNVDVKLTLRWVGFVFIGALIGAVLIHYLPGKVLKVLFNLFIYASLLSLVFKKESEGSAIRPIKLLYYRAYAVFVGCFSVLLGIGGGTLTVPFFKFLNYPYRKAVAVSSSGGFVIGLTGTVLTIILGLGTQGTPAHSLGLVHWMAFLCVFPTAMLFAPIGARMVNLFSEQLNKRLYVGILVFIAVYMTYKLVMTFVH